MPGLLAVNMNCRGNGDPGLKFVFPIFLELSLKSKGNG